MFAVDWLYLMNDITPSSFNPLNYEFCVTYVVLTSLEHAKCPLWRPAFIDVFAVCSATQTQTMCILSVGEVLFLLSNKGDHTVLMYSCAFYESRMPIAKIVPLLANRCRWDSCMNLNGTRIVSIHKPRSTTSDHEKRCSADFAELRSKETTVIPRLTNMIRSGITFVSRNAISRRFLYKIV